MSPSLSRARARTCSGAVLAALAGSFVAAAPIAAHAATTHNVAYVFDFGGGVNDPRGGSSIFSQAVTGSPVGSGNTASYNGATFTNVPVKDIEASPPTALAGYDTVLLYEVCGIGSYPGTLSAVNSLLDNGGKVLIFDGDRCATGTGGPANYSGFRFPFATNSPGPRGNTGGSYGFIETSTLTAGVGNPESGSDALGDSNTFVGNKGAWCTSMIATNVNKNTGNVQAYARTANGGLAIYDGEDFWASWFAAPHLKKIFDNTLAQAWNPDSLPCTNPASGIKLDPAAATDLIGATQVETASVVDNFGHPRAGITVTFTVLGGPDKGLTGTRVTDPTGHASFPVSDTTAAGTDTLQASFNDTDSPPPHFSNKTTITWLARPTTLVYSGATSGDYHDPATLAATLSDTTSGAPIAGATVSLQLGTQPACTGTTDSTGSASCSVTPNEAAGSVPVHASYAGSATTLASSADATFTVTLEETSLVYTGTTHVANGTAAALSGVLTEDGTAPIPGRTVTFTLGTGASQQACSAMTAANGAANCTIASVNQPLTTTATVPISAAFAGDAFYRPATANATALLQYLTGRAFGLSAAVNLGLLNLSVPPTPDTGKITTASAGTTSTPCTATINALGVVVAQTLCVNVATSLAPGTSTATSTVEHVTIGIPGLPVIDATAIKATSTSTCTGANGATTIAKLTIGGVPVTVTPGPNVTISLLGLATLVINEQTPVPGADQGLTVNALHLTGLGGAVNVTVASATSDAHNCG
jgi:hypothetical protein